MLEGLVLIVIVSWTNFDGVLKEDWRIEEEVPIETCQRVRDWLLKTVLVVRCEPLDVKPVEEGL